MRTLVVSDLHLGSRTDADVLRRPGALEQLVAGIREHAPGRLVLLGDTLELRHGPVPAVLASARPVLEAVGAALPDGAEVVVVPGNHDHALVDPWLEQRAGAEASDIAAAVARALGDVACDVAYPGLWLRGDVYATHGHYMDVHVTVPTFERLAAGVMVRVAGRIPEAAGPADYEAVLGPLYAWLHLVARHTRTSFGAERQRGTQNAWKVLTADGPRPLRDRAIKAGFPAAVLALEKAGLGELTADVTPPALRRSGLAAMAEVVRRLGIDARWVLFGHTHRTGPLARDEPGEWQAGPTTLMNTGSWVHEEVFLGAQPRRSPYWPGTAIVVDDDGPPRRAELIEALSPA